MQFKNHRQRKAACWTLMGICGRTDLWSPTGPTEHAVALKDADGGVPSQGERVMLLVTFSFWDRGDEAVSFSELSRLSPENLFGVGSLLAAVVLDRMQLGSVKPCVDQWIADERTLIT